MTPDQYCQQRTAESGSSFYYSFRFLTPAKRRAITTLYAFCREVDDVVDECREPAVASAKLDWWREEVSRAFHGQPQHPVGRALQAILAEFDLAEEYFQEIIDGMAMDLEQQRYADFSQLALYCHRVAGVVGLLAAEIFGYQNRQTRKYAHELGLAFQLTNILRDVKEDLQRDRIYLPQDELSRFSVSEDQLRRGEMTDGMRALFAFQAQRAQQHYDRALALLPEEDRYAQLSGLVMAAIYHATLTAISKQGYPLFERRVRLGLVRKLWLAWNTVRRERQRQRRFLAQPSRG